MGTYNDKFSSDYLPEDLLRECVVALPRVLLALLGDAELTAMYGWGAKIHSDLTYQPMRVWTTWLESFIEDSLEHRIIVPGQSDFLFSIPEERLHIVICHESDIHVNGTDDLLIQRFLQTPPFSNVKFHSRDDGVAEKLFR
jgi:hypothetical protein